MGRGAALLIIGSLAAGCSANVARFGGGLDDMFTASTPNQRAIIPQDQPYPGDPAPAVAGAPAGGVSRGALSPVAGTAPASQAPISGTPAQVAAAPAPSVASPRLDPAPAVAAAPVAAAPSQPAVPGGEDVAGWSRAGGTQIVAKDGETVYNLSRRFGVPAKVIMQVNGISDQGGLRAGQQVIIPTYVYSGRSPVSAPDNDPNVADAKSSRGTKYDVPTDKVPLPGTPSDKVAVLPQTPKPKDGDAAQQPAAAPAAGGTYTVQSGDTLTRIAKKTGVSVAALKEANGLQDGNIRIGQTLRLAPGAAPTQTAAAPKVDPTTTSGTQKAAKPAAEQPADAPKLSTYTPPKKAVEEAAAADDSAAPDATGIGKMRWPVKGRVVSGFGNSGGTRNDGIDIAVPEGTAVKAAENGVVIYAGDGLKEFGNTVLVRHEDGLVTVYGHASELKVTRGQQVKRGQDIAVSGMSGNATSPKLHFEVRKDSAPVDPSGFLQ